MRQAPATKRIKADRPVADPSKRPAIDVLIPDPSGDDITSVRPVGSMTVEDAAIFLKMHPATILAKARAGDIPGAKPGKRWVFLPDDLTGYVRSLYLSSAADVAG